MVTSTIAKLLIFMCMNKFRHLLLVIFIICLSLIAKSQNNHIDVSEFVVSHYMLTYKDDLKCVQSKIDSLGNRTIRDSIVKHSLQATLITNLNNSEKQEVLVRVKGDTIFRNQKVNGQLINKLDVLNKHNGALIIYNNEKTVKLAEHNLFKKDDVYKVIENKGSQKTIQGYPCYEMIVIKNDEISDLGNIIYKMYVTDKIKLPVHTIVNIGKLISNRFPLEVIITEEQLPHIKEIYQIKVMKP